MTEVTTTGPLFDGRAEAALKKYVKDVEKKVADKAEEKIQQRLPQVIRHYTGRYSSSIHQTSDDGGTAVTDMPIVYGPWLEGVGSKNRTTRFKGYHTFRIVGQEVDAEAEQIANEDLKKYLEEMN